MTVLADHPWRPMSKTDPRWIRLTQAFPACSMLPGSWDIRDNAMPTDAPPLLSVPTSDHDRIVEALRHPGQELPQPLIFHVGGADIRYSPRMQEMPSRHGLPWRRWWTVIVGILIKIKALIVVGSLLLSMLVYGLAFGWAYGMGLVVIIAVHEFGHVVANRQKGIPSSLPIFIPFLGAFIQLKQFPKDAGDEAYIGIMGPLFGLAATLCALGVGIATGQAIFFAIAEIGFLLHVFNLMPVLPLDGGRTVGFWQWRAWIPGIFGALVILFYNPFTNQIRIDPIMLIIVALIVVSLAREPRAHQRSYISIPVGTRWRFTVIWAAALALSVAGYWGVGQLHPFV